MCLTFECWYNSSYFAHILKSPVVNDLFIKVDNGLEIVSWICFKIFVGMLFDPKLLLFSKVFIRSDISLGIVGEI